jgi:nucleoid-associated protein YgaU
MNSTSTNLQIVSYDKPEGNQRNNETQTFTVDFNPNTFVISNKIEYKKEEAKGKTGGDPTFDKIPPIEFSIEFTIDGTGVAAASLPNEQQNKYSDIRSNNSNPNKNDYVKTRIKELRKVTGCDINGSIHRPNYLAVLWGTFFIKCILTSLNITYNLFDRNGTPLRAKVNCGFLERKEPGAEGRETMYESSDLTRYRQIKQGDSLSLIAKENYDESLYYIQIAKANKLKNFRNLQPGTTLILPPMKEKDDDE